MCVCVCVCTRTLSHDQSFVTPWTIDCQVPLSIEFSRQEYWNGLPFLPPGDLPNPGIELVSPALAGRFLTIEAPGKTNTHTHTHTHTRMLSRFSCVQLCATLWTIACQSPLYMGFSRQEYWREWISMPSSRGSSLTQELNLCLLHLLHWQVGSSLAPPGKWQGSSSLAPPREKGGGGGCICIYMYLYTHI